MSNQKGSTTDFEHLCDLDERGVSWVTRAKDNMAFNGVKRRLRQPKGKILRDDEVTLRVEKSRTAYQHKRLRRIVALVEIEGKEREMVFITNNFDWAASTVAALYKCRWQIEVFFKQIKQTLQLADFLGNSANAVRWQVWIARLHGYGMTVILDFGSWGDGVGSRAAVFL